MVVSVDLGIEFVKGGREEVLLDMSFLVEGHGFPSHGMSLDISPNQDLAEASCPLQSAYPLGAFSEPNAVRRRIGFDSYKCTAGR